MRIERREQSNHVIYVNVKRIRAAIVLNANGLSKMKKKRTG